jgi:subtilisin family serine protease
MDTGVDLGHPDLASQIAVNPGEIPGNGIDDDSNGLVDDVTGYDFGNDDPDPNPEPLFDEIGLDIGFHGTFVAGVAAAATDNTEGIAGAGWNCRLLPLKVSNTAGELTVEAITAAFGYAADRGVSVLNMSLGGHDRPGVPEYFQALVDMADAAGVLCVAAAGNDGADSLSYPAACDRVLSVGATDIENMRAEFSNFGSWVRVAAPGASLFSTICRNYTVDDLSQLFYIFFFGWDGENPYMFGDGTSFACPLAAGACGLVRHRFPTLTPQQTLQHILVTGDSIAYDQPIGPKLNAFRAVSIGVTAVGAEAPSALAFARGRPNPFRLSTALRFNTAAAGPVTLGIYDTAGRLVRTLLDGVIPAGPHASVWDGADTGGEPVAAGLYFARLESGGRMVRQTLVRLR